LVGRQGGPWQRISTLITRSLNSSFNDAARLFDDDIVEIDSVF
jgi:hypothetical protein